MRFFRDDELCNIFIISDVQLEWAQQEFRDNIDKNIVPN